MNLNSNLVLIGMMGSGKSTIGYLLSKSINLKYVDIDKFIEKETGLKIYNIFEKKGEEYFRSLEEKITLKLLKGKKNIISLGGGGFVNKNIRKEVLMNHLSFWLNWDEKTLLGRIKDSKKRPLTLNATENELIDLIKKRSNTYSKAQYEIKCDKLSKNEIVMKIIKLYEKAIFKN